MEGSPGAPGAFVAVVSAAGRVHSAGSPGEVLLATRIPAVIPALRTRLSKATVRSETPQLPVPVAVYAQWYGF